MATDSGQAGTIDVIEITPGMIDAGVAELREKLIGAPLDQIVTDVFLAMWVSSGRTAAPQPRDRPGT